MAIAAYWHFNIYEQDKFQVFSWVKHDFSDNFGAWFLSLLQIYLLKHLFTWFGKRVNCPSYFLDIKKTVRNKTLIWKNVYIYFIKSSISLFVCYVHLTWTSLLCIHSVNNLHLATDQSVQCLNCTYVLDSMLSCALTVLSKIVVFWLSMSDG